MASAHVDNRPYCAKHDTHYSAMQPCAGCADDPAPAVAVEQETPADPRLIEIERVCRETAKTILDRAEEWIGIRQRDKNKDAIGESTGVKLFDCAAKYLRFEAELVEKRAQRQYMRDLMAHEQCMAGLRKAH